MELNISDAEMVVMRVVWSAGSVRVDDVMAQVAGRQSWSLATVKTLLGRLVKKGMLVTEKNGRSFIYREAVSETAALAQMSTALLSKICATKTTQLLTDMIATSQLTDADVARLTAALAAKKTVSDVACTCLGDFGACTCQHHHDTASANQQKQKIVQMEVH